MWFARAQKISYNLKHPIKEKKYYIFAQNHCVKLFDKVVSSEVSAKVIEMPARILREFQNLNIRR